MKILSIETSCDESGIAFLEATGTARAPKFAVRESLVASQIKIHQPFGGVVPNLAKREHQKNLPILLRRLTKKIGKTKPDLITVTVGPGLEPALWTGIVFAQALAKTYKKPLVGANHLEGHLYSPLLTSATPVQFPAIALIVSGGHTALLKVDSFLKWKRLGETRDDAAGEAFDKVARLMGLPYPGGPEIEKLARRGNPERVAFPRPMLHDKNYDFSFSGLKTAVLYYLRDHKGKNRASQEDIAASFQAAVLDVLATKTMRAAETFDARSVMLSGGVASNKALRARLKKETKKSGLAFHAPGLKYNLDNGAMIAVAGYFAHLRKKRYALRAQGNLDI